MDILRRHAFIIVCVALAGGGIALMITGARAMPKAMEKMEKVQGVYRRLDTLGSNPVNLPGIKAAEERIETVMEDRNEIIRKTEEDFYGYKPLLDGVLPDGNALKRSEFRRAYAAEMEKLLVSLGPFGAPPSRAEIGNWQSRIEREEGERDARGLEGGLSETVPVPEGPPVTMAGVLTTAGAMTSAAARASMNAAQKIYCYARRFDEDRPPDIVPSLEFWREMKDLGTADAPAAWHVWHAQIGYWIQKDAVEAIVAVNQEAAEQIRQEGGYPWVGILPVKEVISVRTSETHIPRDGEDDISGANAGGYSEALPCGTPETVFTHSGQSDRYDVMQFTVKLIMDQRAIPLLLDRILEKSFHTLLRVSYEAVPTNREMTGKVYGSGPVVNIVMDFETILLGNIFRRLMPQEVCEFNDIPCPVRGEGGEGD